MTAKSTEGRAAILQKTTRFIPGLDGLRAIAVVAVLAAHLALMERLHALALAHHFNALSRLFLIDIGDAGVSLFFVISGYLITTLLLKELHAKESVSLRRFYLRRFFRIFPPYYVYLFVVAALWLGHVAPMSRGGLIASFAYYSNYYPYRLSHPETFGWLVGHTWSLSLEEQFYLFWPLLLQKLKIKRAATVGVAILALAPLSRLITFHFFPGLIFDGQIVRMFHTRIDTIMTGSMLALLVDQAEFKARLDRLANVRLTFWLAATVLVVVLYMNATSLRFALLPGVSLQAILMAFLLWCCIAQPETLVGKLLNQPVLRHLGVLSYSLYLWQQLFLGPRLLLHTHPAAGLLAVLVCAELSYWLVETSSFRIRDRVMKHLPVSRIASVL